MIVMKFGGSSVESPEAISRVCSIVKAHIQQHPVVVVSAIGKTTNQLLSIADQAAKGHGYTARRTLSAVQDAHFRIADELVFGEKLVALERSLQKSFRELHAAIHDLSEDGRELTPALSDFIASFGERLSSEIVAAGLLQSRIPAVHLDAREFIVTDDRHSSATPLLWETYARLRRVIPQITEEAVVVMAGFIGATEAGVTTTLGRGGSDLTASIVGAGIAAEEIQIWTDVDGMLTCDPRVLPSVHRLRSISFEEAGALAAAGAKVLHPDTIRPAMRQRIPVTIRNSQRPQIEGTRISDTIGTLQDGAPDGVKAIALKENLVLLEITSKEYPSGSELLTVIRDLCFRKSIEPATICTDGANVFLGLNATPAMDRLNLDLAGCVNVHLRTHAALITLVGNGLAALRSEAGARVLSLLKNVDVQLLPANGKSPWLQMVVPQSVCRVCCERLHREFLTRVDGNLFAPVLMEAQKQENAFEPMVRAARHKNLMWGRSFSNARLT